MTRTFSTSGCGNLLAASFDRVVQERPYRFPNAAPRGQTLMMAADFGGQHKGQYFDTYAFLIFDLDQNSGWLDGQRQFRHTIMPNARRMSFKGMNDKYRRRALIPFLTLADSIDGWLVLFAVSKAGGSLFRHSAEILDGDDFVAGWKPAVRERLLRILHLSAFLLSGLSSPGQNVLWVIDEDEVAANVDQLTHLTNVFSRISSNSFAHGLGHLRCGTTRSDDGTLTLEDLVAICDLAAGAFCEVTTSMFSRGLFPKQNVIASLPGGLSWKSNVMSSWLAANNNSLHRLSCVVELDTTSPGMNTSMMRWQAFSGQLLLPPHPLTDLAWASV
jgi:hypothetical protein